MRLSAYTKILIVLLLLLTTFFTFPTSVSAFSDGWQKGLTIRLTNQSTQGVDDVLSQIVSLGGDFVTVTPGYITDSKTSSNVDSKSSTPSDQILKYMVERAHERGLKVMIKPHLDVKGGGYRGSIDPYDKDKFFSNYKSMVVQYALLSEELNVEQLSVGAELVYLSTDPQNESYWRDIINSVRSVYSGSVTYSANVDEGKFDELYLPFWDALDYIGLSIYRPMYYIDNPSIEDLLGTWQEHEQKYFLPLYQQYKKPIIITEIGYRSVDYAAKRPWDYGGGGSADTQLQKDLYEAFFRYWKDKDYVAGVHIWDFELGDNAGGLSDKGYTPQNKPAADVLKNYFGVSGVGQVGSDTSNLQDNLLITDINFPNSGYFKSIINQNVTFFTDRSYIITYVPNLLKNKILIKTPNDEKNLNDDFVFSFKSNKPISVFVAYDYRSSTIPDWLSSYTKTQDSIYTTDTTFELYQQNYNAGEVIEFGGNRQNPANGAQSNYFVIVAEQVEGQADVIQPTPTPTIVPTPSPTPTIQVTPIPSPTVAPFPTPIPTLPTATTILSSDIVIHEPNQWQEMSGEKKIKVYVKDMELHEYTATYEVDGKGQNNMPNSKDGRYKQVKEQFDNYTWNGKGPYTIVVRIFDNGGSYLGENSVEVYVR